MAEDARFAAACNLEFRFLELGCATYVGHRSSDLPWVGRNVERIEPVLMAALSDRAARGQPGVRPWLFCPCGIGGHVDHLAIRMIVTRHAERLAESFRLAFYEDLSYASDPVARWSGIAELLRALPGRPVRRHAWPLGDAIGTKLALIRLYASQFIEPPQSIGRFTPASDATLPPHEAVWTAEPGGPA